jgi:hypothetical protein
VGNVIIPRPGVPKRDLPEMLLTTPPTRVFAYSPCRTPTHPDDSGVLLRPRPNKPRTQNFTSGVFWGVNKGLMKSMRGVYVAWDEVETGYQP